MVICIFCIDWLADKLGLLPHVFTYYAEGFASFLMFAAALIFSQRQKFDIDPKIAVLVSFIILAFLASAISNNVSSGVLIGGVRIHLKFLPFLILPLVYQFTDTQIRQQFIFVLTLSLIQVPVAFYQKFVKYAASNSGDPVGGTLGANASGDHAGGPATRGSNALRGPPCCAPSSPSACTSMRPCRTHRILLVDHVEYYRRRPAAASEVWT